MSESISKLDEVLRMLLKEKGLSTHQLSKETGVPQSTISGWLSGSKQQRPEQLVRVSRYLGVSLDYLICGEDPSRPPTLNEAILEKIFDGYLKVKVERVIPALAAAPVNEKK